MAGFTKCLIYALVSLSRPQVQNLSYKCMQCIIAWPVAKILELSLGSHHGIIYRRAGTHHLHLLQLSKPFTDTLSSELKELIAMHSSQATHGGDLKLDTVTIIGATLDLQEKVVKQVRILFDPPGTTWLIPDLRL